MSELISGLNQSNDIENIKTTGGSMHVKGVGKSSSATFTRPADATAYTALDVCGESPATVMALNNVAVNSGAEIMITRAELEVDVDTIPAGMSGYRLHLYNALPTGLIDNAAFNVIAADRTKYLGYIEFDAPIDLGDTLYTQAENVNKQLSLATSSTTLYGQLQTLGAYTPTSGVVKKVTIRAVEV